MEFIGAVIWWFVTTILQLLWWMIVTFHPVIIMGLLIGTPLYYLSKLEGPWVRMVKPLPERQYRLTPQYPSVYYNQIGDLTLTKPDPKIEHAIREHFRETNVTEKTFRQ